MSWLEVPSCAHLARAMRASHTWELAREGRRIEMEVSVNHSVSPTLCDPMDCSPPWLLCPWDSPGRTTRVDCHFLPPGDFPGAGIEPRSPALRADSLLPEPLRWKLAPIQLAVRVSGSLRGEWGGSWAAPCDYPLRLAGAGRLSAGDRHKNILLLLKHMETLRVELSSGNWGWRKWPLENLRGIRHCGFVLSAI